VSSAGTGGGAPLDPTTVALKDPADDTYKANVSIPGEGTYTVDPATGKVTFDPDPAFSGPATPVTYQVKDGDGVTATSSITITVTAITPNAVNDAATTPTDTNITVPVVGNDTPGAASAPLDPTSVLLKDPANGTYQASVTVAGQGTYTVDPTTGAVTFDPLPTFAGTATAITYQIKDANGTPDTATLTIKVKGAPDANPDAASTRQNTDVTVDPLANDTAGSAGGAPLDPTTVLLKDPADGTYQATVTIPGEGKYTVDPASGAITFDPDPTFTGGATPVTYQVKDGDGITATSTISITVADVLPSASPDTVTGKQDLNVTLDPLANDVAGDPSAPLDPTTVLLRDPADDVYKTSVTVPGEGTYTVDPTTGTVTFDPDPAFTGPSTPITYQVKDSNGTPATATITVVLAPVVPAVLDDTATTPSDIPVTVDVLGNDRPGDPSAPLDPTTVLLRDPADDAYKTSVTIPGEGTYTVDPTTGTVTFDPDPAFTGPATPITYQVKDENGTPGTGALSVAVSPPPTVKPDTGTTKQDVPVTIDPLANDVPGGAPLDPTTVLLKDPADGTFKATVTIPGEGKYTVDPATGKVTFDPDPAFTGPATPITYQVTDGDGITGSATLTLSVTPIVPAPVDDVAGTPSGLPAVVDVLGNDAPGDPSAPLDPTSVLLLDPADGVFKTSVTVPGVGDYVVDPVTGKITFTPEPAFDGIAPPLTYRVSDENGSTGTATLTMRSTPPPTAAPDTASTTQNVNVIVDPLANDIAGGAPLDPATVRLKDPADGAYKTSVTVPGEGTYTVDTATGKITFDPLPTFTGTTEPLTYRVQDGDGLAVTSTLTVGVAVTLPSARPDFASTTQGVPITRPLLGNDTITPGVPFVPSSVRLMAPGSTVPGAKADAGAWVTELTVPGEGTYRVGSDGRITYSPDPAFTGTAKAVPYMVQDELGRTVMSTFTPTVIASRMGHNDTAVTPAGQPVVIDVLANDTIVPGVPLDPSTLRLIDPRTGKLVTTLVIPGEGTWTVDNVKGLLIFTPVKGFTGKTTPIRYLIKDRDGRSTTATVTVTVLGESAGPVPVGPVPVGFLAFTGPVGLAAGLAGVGWVLAGALMVVSARRRRRTGDIGTDGLGTG
jgi:CshA-type fibril repeat protein